MTLSRRPLAAILILMGVLAAPLAHAADAAPPRLLTVAGEGAVKSVPDQAQLSAGVTTQAATAASALAANSAAMNNVFATLRRAGIADKQVQTSGFSVSPQYAAYKPGTSGPQRIIGYEVSNNVSVTVDNLAKVGPTLDALVASGANQLGGVSFSIHDPKPMLRQARDAAVKDAIDRAETYASAAGIVLGPIVSIQEGANEQPRPMYRMAVMEAAPSQSTPIAAGEESVTANVTITWEIK